jgi:hypothetical protein
MFHTFSSITNLAHVIAWSRYLILSLAPITYICWNVARSCFKHGCTWNDDAYGNDMPWPCSTDANMQGKNPGCYSKRAGLKSFVVSIDYQDYMGSSSKIWAFRRLFLYLYSYNLVGSVTAGTGAEFNIKHIVRVFENKRVCFAKSVKNLKFISISMPVITSLSPNKDS